MNLKKRAMQLAAVLLSLAVLLPSVPAAFASQSAAEGTAIVFSESGITAAIRVVPWVIAAAFLKGLASTVGAALLPASSLARVPVVEALRRGL